MSCILLSVLYSKNVHRQNSWNLNMMNTCDLTLYSVSYIDFLAGHSNFAKS
jgi:hypothetical protein